MAQNRQNCRARAFQQSIPIRVADQMTPARAGISLRSTEDGGQKTDERLQITDQMTQALVLSAVEGKRDGILPINSRTWCARRKIPVF